MNVLLFVPLGSLVRSKEGIILGIGLSIAIEAIQYAFELGYCEIDDVINNSIGLIVGFFVFQVLHRIYISKITKKAG